jgi:transposase-like protein
LSGHRFLRYKAEWEKTALEKEKPMTKEKVDESQVLGKLLVEQHGDFLRKLLKSALTQVMEAEVAERCGAGPGERSMDRVNRRNGYRDRDLETRLGTVDLAIPKLRQGTYFPTFLEPRRRWEKAFVSVVAESYVLGVSTRKVDELVKALGAQGISKSEVSRMSAVLDGQVEEFRQRPLTRVFPYVFLDALYIKVREGQHVVSKAVLVAYGVAETGERDVLGCAVAAGEMEDSWKAFLTGLLDRGLRGVRLVISDNHAGLKRAIRGVLNGVSWQRCVVHFLRNVLTRVPRKAQGMVAALLRTVFAQAGLADAKEALGKALEVLDRQFPEAAKVVRDGEDDVLTHMSFPVAHWRQIRSTNPLERLNREIRRRTDVVGIFPTSGSAVRLIGMVLVEQSDEWAVGRRYFSLESMELLMKPATGLLEAVA